MKRRIALHGALREADPAGHIEMDIPDGCTIADLREQLIAYLHEHAPQVSEGVVRRSAFASAESILHDQQTVPDDGQLAILPPVSGG